MITHCIMGLITLYKRLVAPLLPPAICRFEPTCSQYACDAVVKYGPFRGTVLALGRIARCHPWHERRFDPVP
ncbi:MAG TPA: membrane protein insertion efficiency factor YidD [Candidatus Baltobacteraceae bacterium]|jgi:hypothetical protein|nr:membrane protein insertion efficiency factor YidD [Candidatus Baltobacteraceae bacterium]